MISEAQWKSRRARSLVKLLALAPGHRLHRDQVIEALWPEFRPLRRSQQLPPDPLRRPARCSNQPGEVSLALEEGFLSLSGGKGSAVGGCRAVRSRRRPGQRSQDPQATRLRWLYTQATCCRMTPTKNGPSRAAKRCSQVYLNLLLDLARLHETRREYPPAIETLQRLLSTDPSHEEAHAGLMRLYALSRPAPAGPAPVPDPARGAAGRAGR